LLESQKTKILRIIVFVHCTKSFAQTESLQHHLLLICYGRLPKETQQCADGA